MLKGSHHTENAKTRIGRASLGRKLTEEHKAKIGAKSRGNHYALGHSHPQTEETKAKIRQAMLGNKYSLGHHHTAETKEKISRANSSRPRRPEEIARLRWLNQHKPPCSPETRLKLSLTSRSRKHSDESKAKISRAHTGMKFSAQHCVHIGESKKRAWSDPTWRDKTVRAQRIGCLVHPNKAEIALGQLLETSYPGEWKFVGDGSFVLGGKNPDFVNINGRKEIIELFGNYWHRGENPAERVDLFRQYGFQTIVIWENDLEHPETVLEKITDIRIGVRITE